MFLFGKKKKDGAAVQSAPPEAAGVSCGVKVLADH